MVSLDLFSHICAFTQHANVRQTKKQKRTVNRDSLSKRIKLVTGWINKWTNELFGKRTNYGWIKNKKKEISVAINSDKKKNCLQPSERFALSSPGLQDQCSNHWANEASTLVLKRATTKKERKKQTKTTVNRDTLSKKIKRLKK